MEKYKFYEMPNSDVLKKDMLVIKECWDSFLELYKNEENINCNITYTMDTLALEEMVKRVYERRDYFARYHKGMEMSEFKEIGLYMFWLVKFQVFRINCDEIDSKAKFNINEDFSLYFMLCALKNLANKLQLKYDSFKLQGRVYSEILYSLAFRDLSKEALGLIVELVANIVIRDLPYKKS